MIVVVGWLQVVTMRLVLWGFTFEVGGQILPLSFHFFTLFDESSDEILLVRVSESNL